MKIERSVFDPFEVLFGLASIEVQILSSLVVKAPIQNLSKGLRYL